MANAQSSLVKSYLIAYNLLEDIGWVYTLFNVLNILRNDWRQPLLKRNNDTQEEAWTDQLSPNIWRKQGNTIKFMQTSAILETVHAMLGFVRGGWHSSFQQFCGRMWITYGVADFVPDNKFMVPLSLAWSAADIIRFTFYVTELLQITPYFLKWLRYSAFLVLYPIGMTSEIALVIDAVRNGRGFPQSHRAIYLFLVSIFALIIVPIGYPKVFKHMLKQRRQKLTAL